MNTFETIAAPQQESQRTVRYPVLIYMILLISYLINIMDRQLFSTWQLKFATPCGLRCHKQVLRRQCSRLA
jgi:hypothetical protein